MTPPGLIILVELINFDLEEDFDYLFVYTEKKPDFDNADLIFKLSGHVELENTTYWSYMWLHFFSDPSVTDQGFSMRVTAYDTGKMVPFHLNHLDLHLFYELNKTETNFMF